MELKEVSELYQFIVVGEIEYIFILVMLSMDLLIFIYFFYFTTKKSREARRNHKQVNALILVRE